MKLRKLRALRGNQDSGMQQQRQLQMPASVSADLDSIRALFTDKEKELTLAVRKVEDLTHQLEVISLSYLKNKTKEDFSP